MQYLHFFTKFMSFTPCEMNNTPRDKKKKKKGGGLALKNGHFLRQKRVGAGAYVGVMVGIFSSESQQT